MFDLTEEQVREAEMIAESETIPDGLGGWGRSTTGVTILMLLGLVHAAVFHPLECLSVDFGLAMVVPGHALRLRNGWSPRRL